MSHYGTTPSEVVDAIITALELFKKGPANPDGAVKSVERIEDDHLESQLGIKIRSSFVAALASVAGVG